MPRSRLLSLSLPLLFACNAPASDPGGVAQGETTAATPGPEPPGTTSPPDAPTTGAAPDPTTSTTSTTTASTSTTAADETTAASVGTTGAPPVCGDGHIDPGEMCDWGYEFNSDVGICTTTCNNAVCGDKFVWAGEEECDLGPDNNDEIYGGCTTQCTLGAGCGDGQVQGPEECDQGALINGTGAHATDGVPCTQTCRYAALQVFLSSTVYQGGQLGGLQEADEQCRLLAKGSAFDNAVNFRAWISAGLNGPATLLKKGAPGVPYVRPDGIRVADDYDHLVQFGPIAGITVTETGQTLLDARVWTATALDGAPIDGDVDCHGWTTSSALFKGRVGRSGVDKQDLAEWEKWQSKRQWTDYASFSCVYNYRIYCFEQ